MFSMEIRRYLIIVFVLVLAPSFVHATGTVRINEIAWMGTKTSANAEWIELFNIGDTKIPLNGWTLKAKDGSPNIHFSSKDAISPHGYFLLERTRNGAVSGVTADKIYTGSLKNSGEALVLTNNASTTIDTVIGGKNWCAIGGNNSTKQTAQRTASGWITATGTPRAINVAIGVMPSCATVQNPGAGSAGAGVGTTTATNTATTTVTAATTTVIQTSATSNSGHDGPPEFEPVPAVFISIGKDMDIVAGADVRFSAEVTDKSGKQYSSAVVYWAFGDGSKATGTSVFKNYRAPGTYAVVANAVQGLGSGEDDLTVTVRNVHVSIPSVSARGITVQNNTPYRLDMSLWRLRAGTTTFALPLHTVILPNTAVLFPKDITKLSVTNNTVLLYPNGKEVARYAFGSSAKRVALGTAKKLSPVSVRYSTVQGGENGDENTQRAMQQHIINAHNTPLSYDAETSIAPASAIDIADAGAPVAEAFSGRGVTSVAPLPEPSATSAISSPTSFTHRFLSVPWTLPLLLILILSIAGFILL